MNCNLCESALVDIYQFPDTTWLVQCIACKHIEIRKKTDGFEYTLSDQATPVRTYVKPTPVDPGKEDFP